MTNQYANVKQSSPPPQENCKVHFNGSVTAQAIRIKRTTVTHGKQTNEVAYATTSLSPERAPAGDLLGGNRGHWSIGNRLHWVHGVTFGEDGCRMRTSNGPQNLAALRNAGLSLLRFSKVNSESLPPQGTSQQSHGNCSDYYAACKRISPWADIPVPCFLVLSRKTEFARTTHR